MKVYLDICCLKRPFDDQRQERVRIETEIVLGIVAAFELGQITLVRSPAHDLENNQNSLHWRAERARLLLERVGFIAPSSATDDNMRTRVADLMARGFRNFDALHLAYAEALSADRFVTCDDGLLVRARRQAPDIRVRVVSLIEFAQEVFE